MQRGDRLITDKKITAADYADKDVVSAPDRLTGTAQENKYVFDRAVKEVVQPKYNALIDELDTELGSRIVSDDILKMRLDENGVVEYSADGTNYVKMIGRHGAKGDGTPATGAEIFNDPDNVASGSYSHAEGINTKANGQSAHAEGADTIASGINSHAEGLMSKAEGKAAHAEGLFTTASGDYSHAEGWMTTASGESAHAQGCETISSGSFSHSGGKNTIASADYQTAIGKYNTEDETAAVIVGNGASEIARSNAMTLDWNGNLKLAGDVTFSGDRSLTDELSNLTAEDVGAAPAVHTHTADDISGLDPVATSGYVSVGRRDGTIVGAESTAEGKNTIASGKTAHAEGDSTEASGSYSHAEGKSTKATGYVVHAEGYDSEASGSYSHAEGKSTKAIDYAAHAEGNYSEASGNCSHAEGTETKAIGYAAHAEGSCTEARGDYSHARGYYTLTNSNCQSAIGKYNAEDITAALILGNGTSTSNRSNAMTVDWNGNLNLAGDITFSGNRSLTEELNNITIPIAGDELGGVKNGGSVIIKSDGTMDAPTGGSRDGSIKANKMVLADCIRKLISVSTGSGGSSYYLNILKFTYYETDFGSVTSLPIRFQAQAAGVSTIRIQVEGLVIHSDGSGTNIRSDEMNVNLPSSIKKGDLIIASLNLDTMEFTILEINAIPLGTVSAINNHVPNDNGAVTLAARDVGAASEDHVHEIATTNTAGFLSASDKTKLDSLSSTIPVAGDELGGVKNGGNVVVNSDGTMTAPEGGGSGGAVESVNGKTGAVTLTADDISALSKTAQTVTNWNNATNTGVYTSDLTAQNLPDMEADSSGGVCNGLTINDAQFIMCSDYSMMNIWAGYRHYMGSGYFTEWTQFLSSSSGFSAITVTDWNNATQTGFYTSNADADNAPYPYTYDTCFGFVIANTSAAQQFVFRESKASNGIVDNALYTRSVRLNSRPVYYGEWQLVNKQAAADVPITAISGMTATTVQEALEENFQSVVDGKSSLETAITDKGGTVSKTGDVATFAELTAGVGTISGGGSSEDYVNMLKRDSASVVIPTETTALGDRVFYNWSTLTSISGWDNVNAIGEYTFNGCTVFAPDKLPDNLTSIGRSAFQRCTALAITALPENLATIGDYAFEVCTALALTNLPDGLTEIPQSAFASCPNLALTSLPAGLTAIKNRAFQYDTNLALTSLPAGITQLDAYTFQNCTSLKITSLPDALTTIGSMVFAGCTGLTSITIGPNVTSIVTTAFSGCTNLTQITCGFAQGAVSGAPWGATNANITYVLL